MDYDFTTLPDRGGSSAEKFYNMKKLNPGVSSGILPFSVADMDFLPPPQLTEGLKEFVGNTIFGYTLPWESYYEAVFGWMKKRHGLEISREWLLDADNVIAALRQMIRAFTAPGDGIVVMTPAYPAFLSSVEATGRRLEPCPLRLQGTAYSIDFDLLESLCGKEDVTLLILCNPHNPIGRLWTREELERTARICLEHQVFVVSDEIHWDLVLPGHTFTSMASLGEEYLRNCAVSTSYTKTFNMAALKGASVIMRDRERREQFEKQGTVPGRDILSYAACEISYSRCEDWLDQLLRVLESNRRLIKEFMEAEIPEATVIDHQATYLQWLDFRFLGMDDRELERFMAFEAECFCTEGYKFGPGGSGFERWNFACPRETLYDGLERMKDAVNRWKQKGCRGAR